MDIGIRYFIVIHGNRKNMTVKAIITARVILQILIFLHIPDSVFSHEII